MQNYAELRATGKCGTILDNLTPSDIDVLMRFEDEVSYVVNCSASFIHSRCILFSIMIIIIMIVIIIITTIVRSARVAGADISHLKHTALP